MVWWFESNIIVSQCTGPFIVVSRRSCGWFDTSLDAIRKLVWEGVPIAYSLQSITLLGTICQFWWCTSKSSPALLPGGISGRPRGKSEFMALARASGAWVAFLSLFYWFNAAAFFSCVFMLFHCVGSFRLRKCSPLFHQVVLGLLLFLLACRVCSGSGGDYPVVFVLVCVGLYVVKDSIHVLLAQLEWGKFHIIHIDYGIGSLESGVRDPI